MVFRSTLNNPHHTLHVLLPPQSTTSQNYQLRQRVHDRQLPEHTGHLIDKNFIMRSLYKDMYWLLLLCNLVCVANCVLSVLNKENDYDDDDVCFHSDDDRLEVLCIQMNFCGKNIVVGGSVGVLEWSFMTIVQYWHPLQWRLIWWGAHSRKTVRDKCATLAPNVGSTSNISILDKFATISA